MFIVLDVASHVTRGMLRRLPKFLDLCKQTYSSPATSFHQFNFVTSCAGTVSERSECDPSLAAAVAAAVAAAAAAAAAHS
jgi:hypothetical protein